MEIRKLNEDGAPITIQSFRFPDDFPGHKVCPLTARSITSCIFIARSTARAEYFSIGVFPFPMALYPNPDR